MEKARPKKEGKWKRKTKKGKMKSKVKPISERMEYLKERGKWKS